MSIKLSADVRCDLLGIHIRKNDKGIIATCTVAISATFNLGLGARHRGILTKLESDTLKVDAGALHDALACFSRSREPDLAPKRYEHIVVRLNKGE